jgi:hypothetical protein
MMCTDEMVAEAGQWAAARDVHERRLGRRRPAILRVQSVRPTIAQNKAQRRPRNAHKMALQRGIFSTES